MTELDNIKDIISKYAPHVKYYTDGKYNKIREVKERRRDELTSIIESLTGVDVKGFNKFKIIELPTFNSKVIITARYPQLYSKEDEVESEVQYIKDVIFSVIDAEDIIEIDIKPDSIAMDDGILEVVTLKDIGKLCSILRVENRCTDLDVEVHIAARDIIDNDGYNEEGGYYNLVDVGDSSLYEKLLETIKS